MSVQVYMPGDVAPTSVVSSASAASRARMDASSVGKVTWTILSAMGATLSFAPFVPAGTFMVTVTVRPPLSATLVSVDTDLTVTCGPKGGAIGVAL